MAPHRNPAIRAIDNLLFDGHEPTKADRKLTSWQNLLEQGCFTTASAITFGPRCGAALGISIERQSVSWAIVADPMGKEICADKVLMPIAPLADAEHPNPPRLTPDEFVERLHDVLEEARTRAPTTTLAGVGVAWPSVIGPSGDPTYESHHPDFARRDIHADIRGVVEAAGFHALAETEQPLPVSFINDADADLLFEARWGVAAGCRDVLAVKLCGGLGAAVLHEGQLMHGAHGRAGEIKHTPVRWESASKLKPDYKEKVLDLDDDNLPACDCGRHTCVGKFATGRAIIDQLPEYRDLDYNVRGTQIQEHSSADHANAACITAVFARAGALLGEALIAPVRLLDPQLVVISAFPRHEHLAGTVFETLLTNKVDIDRKAVVMSTPGAHVTAAGAARLIVEEQILPVLEHTKGVAIKSSVSPFDLPSALRRYVMPWDGDDIGDYVRGYRPLSS